MALKETDDAQTKLLENYFVEANNISVEVRIEKTKGFTLSYKLALPDFGPGTKALLEQLKNEIISDASIKAEKLMEPEFMKGLQEKFSLKAKEILDRELGSLDDKDKQIMIGILLQEMLGLGKLEFLLGDQQIEEIVINSSKEPVWTYHKKFGWLKTNIAIENENQIQNYASIIARRIGKQITVLNPLLDAHLITGDRVNATLFPISSKGNTLTIRKFRRDPWTATDYISNNTSSVEAMAFIWQAMQYELNIIVSGGTASGKCVSGESEIVLVNERKKIKDFVEEELKKNKTEIIDGFYSCPSNAMALSFNPDTLDVEFKEIERVWKRKAPEELISITTQTGKKITTTSEHPFFLIDNGIKKTRADELKEKTYIATPRKIDFAGKDFEINYDLVDCAKKKFGLHLLAKAKTSNKWIKLPLKVDYLLARFLGYVIGDGHITKNRQAIRFFNKSDELLEDFKKCGEETFGIAGKYLSYKNKTPYIEFNSSIIAKALAIAMQVPSGNKSHIVQIPEFILHNKKEILSEFIKALFECEASIDKKKKWLEFSSASKQLVKDLKFSLNRYEISCIAKYFSSRNRLFIAGKNLVEFNKKIGFISKLNNEIKLVSFNRFSPNYDFVPNVNNIIKELKEKLKMHAKEMNGDISREAISRYVCNKRAPQRESLMQVVNCFKERINNLKEMKNTLKIIEEETETNYRIIKLIKIIRKTLKINKKKLAEISQVSKETIWNWEANNTAPEINCLLKVAEGLTKEFNLQITNLQESNDLSLLNINKKEVAQLIGVKPFTFYAGFRKHGANYGESLAAIHSIKLERLNEIKAVSATVNELDLVVKKTNPECKIKEIRKKLKIKVIERKNNAIEKIKEILNNALSNECLAKIELLDKLCNSNILWDKIIKIEKIKSAEQWVYDLSVKDNHTFIANEIIAHNTSLLNVCLPFIQPNQRIVSIEDTRELTLPDFLHWVPLTTREANIEGKGEVEMLDLLLNSLRMRPDRIIVGEVRRQREIEVMFEAMHTGHSVSTTLHANNSEETIQRLINPPINTPEIMLQAVHLNLVMYRNRRTGIRRLTEISEFAPEKRNDKQGVKTNALFTWVPKTDALIAKSKPTKVQEELLNQTGFTEIELANDLKEKKDILKWMVKNNVNKINEVGLTMAQYYLEPETILKKISK